MSCPRCKAAMLAVPVLGGMAWTCPSEGCGWFVLVELRDRDAARQPDNKANDVERQRRRLALGGRRLAVPNERAVSVARQSGFQEAR